MKHVLITSVIASMILTIMPATAGTVLEVAMGNTVSITTDDVETRYYFNDNGSVSLSNAKGESDVGTWSTSTGDLCMNWSAADAPVCMPVSDQQASVGDTVAISGSDGAMTDVTILAGKVPF